MSRFTVKNKLATLQAELQLLKKAVSGRPDFAIDDANWKKIRPTAKRIRRRLFKETYG